MVHISLLALVLSATGLAATTPVASKPGIPAHPTIIRPTGTPATHVIGHTVPVSALQATISGAAKSTGRSIPVAVPHTRSLAKIHREGYKGVGKIVPKAAKPGHGAATTPSVGLSVKISGAAPSSVHAPTKAVHTVASRAVVARNAAYRGAKPKSAHESIGGIPTPSMAKVARAVYRGDEHRGGHRSAGATPLSAARVVVREYKADKGPKGAESTPTGKAGPKAGSRIDKIARFARD